MSEVKKSKRGRPVGSRNARNETRAQLIRAGVELLTEKGFTSTGLEEILRKVNVPKGSFYYYFDSKEQFGAALIESYGAYFGAKLDLFFLDEDVSPLQRLVNFVGHARHNMARFDFNRGCLIANLGQEMSVLPGTFRQQLIDVFNDWQARTAKCFKAAQEAGEIDTTFDSDELAAQFWIGWEGAVLRAKLERQAFPMDIFFRGFMKSLNSKV
ncbi:MAG: TetR family transcriptional regulator [Rhodomicrobium sp.]|nr:MAG: TetR family transcriptional regulator [Rhodomicrobium sp.]